MKQWKEYYRMVQVNGIWAPAAYWAASDISKASFTNGCGPGNWKVKFNSILGMDARLVCNIHDWMYEFADKCDGCKEYCDDIFLKNLNTLNSKSHYV